MNDVNLSKLQGILEYEFKDITLLETATLHSSYIKEHGSEKSSNERLEFLGDSCLGLVIAEILYRKNIANEGLMTQLKANIVCEDSLAKLARRLKLGVFLRMSKGQLNINGKNNSSMLADFVESIIGAIYLDGGFFEAKKFISRVFHSLIDAAIEGKLFSDYKSKLQEYYQKRGENIPTYRLLKKTGMDHNPSFEIGVYSWDGRCLAVAKATTKKEAEKQAAKKALGNISTEVNEDDI